MRSLLAGVGAGVVIGAGLFLSLVGHTDWRAYAVICMAGAIVTLYGLWPAKPDRNTS